MQTGQVHEIPPPHEYFTKKEQALFRNLNAWYFKSEEIDLPGPAWWWPDDYDFKKHNWDADKDDRGAREAFFMMASWLFD